MEFEKIREEGYPRFSTLYLTKGCAIKRKQPHSLDRNKEKIN